MANKAYKFSKGLNAFQIAHFPDGFCLKVEMPMEEFGWNHPMAFAGLGFTIKEIEGFMYDVLYDCKSIENIPISEKLKDVTAEFYGKVI